MGLFDFIAKPLISGIQTISQVALPALRQFDPLGIANPVLDIIQRDPVAAHIITGKPLPAPAQAGVA